MLARAPPRGAPPRLPARILYADSPCSTHKRRTGHAWPALRWREARRTRIFTPLRSQSSLRTAWAPPPAQGDAGAHRSSPPLEAEKESTYRACVPSSSPPYSAGYPPLRPARRVSHEARAAAGFSSSSSVAVAVALREPPRVRVLLISAMRVVGATPQRVVGATPQRVVGATPQRVSGPPLSACRGHPSARVGATWWAAPPASAACRPSACQARAPAPVSAHAGSCCQTRAARSPW